MSPAKFWHPQEPIVRSPTCDTNWQEELASATQSRHPQQAQVADLLNIALLMNPSTHQTWANARAAAYQEEIARAALYPELTLEEDLILTDTRWDDGSPFLSSQISNPPTQLHSLHALHKKCTQFQTKRGVFDALKAIATHSYLDFYEKNSALTNEKNNETTATGQDPTNAIVLGDTSESIGPSRLLTHNLSLSYLLLDFGGRNARIEAAKQALYYSNWTHNRQIQTVIIDVLQSYYTYLGISYLLEARNSDLENAQKNYESANAQFEAGIRNKVDVLQAKTDVINIQLMITDLQGQQRIARGRLANAMGLSATAIFPIPAIPSNLAVEVSIEKIEKLIEDAKNMRPDLAAAYAAYEQRKQEVIVARSAGLPVLGTLVNLQETNDFINPSFNNHAISGSLMVSAPLFSGFLYINQERQAREFVRAACANIRAIEMNISLDVLTSYWNFKTAVESLKYSDEYVKFSEEAYMAAFLTYQEGISTILDVLSAQRTLANAKAQKIQARTQWAIALSTISFAVGALGTESEIKPWEQKEHPHAK